MRALFVVIGVAGLSTACAPLYGAYMPSRAGAWSSPAMTGPSINLAAVTGRWDNVMMLPKGAQVHVLQMDGVQAEGELVSATASALKLMVASGAIEIAAETVARIDRIQGSARARQTLSGAAHGVGLVGFLGLLTGQAPPARLFAAGALAGGEAGHHAGGPAGPQTIYLAPQLRR